MKEINLITDEILNDIDRMIKECHRLHVPSPPVHFIMLEVLDPSGEVLEKYKSKSNSWVRNAYNVITQQFLPCSSYQGSSTYGAGSQAGKNLAGTTRRTAGLFAAPVTATMAGNAYNNAADSTVGILVGTSNTAESFDHYGLQAIIAHGSSTGQLMYAAMSEPTTTYDSGTKKWTGTAIRTFSNSSGATITVKEVGDARRVAIGAASGEIALFSRDVLSTAIDVPSGSTLRVTYTSEMTYPA